MAPRSLQARLTLGVLALVGAVWLATAVLVARDAGHELDELLDGHLAQAAALLVAQQARELDDAHEGRDERAIDAPVLHRYAPRVAFQVFHENRLALRSAGAPAEPLLAEAVVARHQGFHTVERDGLRWRVFATRGAEHDIQVYVAEQMVARSEIVRAVLRSLLAPAALAVPLLALGVWWAVRRGSAPLRQLQAQLAQREPQALAPVALPDAPAEMQPMVQALNALLARIGALVEGERRFTADAAHELRTPIAAIRAQAQVALGASSEPERRQALAATLDGCDRATRLVAQLLTLSRLEAAADAPALQPVDLVALARQVVADAAPEAIAQDRQIALDAPASACPVPGDATLLAVLLRNLVDNALRYSPPGAAVQVSVLSAAPGQGVQLRVDDSGPGLSEADLARLGERFFRVLGHGQDGSGLGWSIVRRIADVHGAAVTAGRSAALGGLAVSVQWPAG
ncbi:ATP-binding protein [Ideonella sp. DXS22W]|uniref:histidine kinase n=1 Tax=Pseudaquabacterium inlustre TaxID=2984192 RepID=A0ABU9CJJ1_9BURK